MAELAIAAAIGVVAGVWLGMRWAERCRALHDIRKYIRKTWRERDEYRTRRR